jgi:hypothetical protein
VAQFDELRANPDLADDRVGALSIALEPLSEGSEDYLVEFLAVDFARPFVKPGSVIHVLEGTREVASLVVTRLL